MKVTLLGAGAMGTGIGQIAAQNGCEVVYYDTYTPSLERSRGSIEKITNRLVEKGRLTKEARASMLSNMSWTSDLANAAGSQLVVEAVVERLDVKKELFTAVEGHVDANCILCSNTSSLSIAAISSALQHPERFGGLHFFNPAPLMPLVEIIPGVRTAEGWAEHLEELMNSWGKVPVIAKDTPGFIVNRVARPFYSESIKLYEEGVASPAQIDTALRGAGFKMGPFQLTDLIGHDVNYTVTETVWSQFYYDGRFRPSVTQKRLVEAGLLGKKTGHGFYSYADGAGAPEEAMDAGLAEKIVHRVVAMLANEALDAVWLGIASATNVDLAMTKGVNYPKGPLAWGKELGWAYILEILERCHNHYGDDRYRPNPLLRHLVADNGELGAGALEDSFMI